MRILLCLIFAATLCQAEKISTASWNIRSITKWDSLNGHYWKDRMPHIVGLVQSYDFDLLALQEVSERQLVVLKKQLDNYTFISAGRDDGALRGEALGILYKREKLTAVDSGHFWLSETPDVPSIGWDGECRRICVWAKFLEKSSQKEIRVFVVHLDHKGELARVNGARQIIDSVRASESLAIVLGDFNALKNSPLYESVLAEGFFDASTLARNVYVPSGTYNMYTFKKKIEDVSDMIFISKPIFLEYYGVLNNFFWQENSIKHISDHYPVLIRFDTVKETH